MIAIILFMALTFTLTSFTCTVQFVGLLLVAASRGSYMWPILGMIIFSLAFSLPFFFGGTSLLIVVVVAMDTVAQIQSYLLAHQYEGLIRKSRLKGRRG